MPLHRVLALWIQYHVLPKYIHYFTFIHYSGSEVSLWFLQFLNFLLFLFSRFLLLRHHTDLGI